MATVRKDNNGRILKTNEYQRADGRMSTSIRRSIRYIVCIVGD